MTARLWIHRWLRPACCLLLLLGAACGGSPEARPPRQPQPAAAPAEPAARPLTPPGAERFTTEEIARVYSEMKSCADRSGEPENLFTCACEQDLALSPTFKPADPTAHCADFARRASALLKLSEQEQLRAPPLQASPEVGASGAFSIFMFARPCILKAAQAGSAEFTIKCMCLTHALSNGLARHTAVRTNAEMAAVVQQETDRILRDDSCEAPLPAAVGIAAPERFTMEQIANAFNEMRKCAIVSTSPDKTFSCGCEQDLAMSRTFKPADAKAHCAEFTRRALALIKLSDEEQQQAPPLVASPEVGAIGAAFLFAFSAPCMIDATKARSAEQGYRCMCLAHTLVNRFAMHPPPRTSREVMDVFLGELKRMTDEGSCELARR